MAQVSEIAEASPPTDRPPPVGAALRMRRVRERRRRGLYYTATLLDERQIEGLIRRGWLARGERGQAAAVRKALYQYLVDNLG
jgi:hypothetical protein